MSKKQERGRRLEMVRNAPLSPEAAATRLAAHMLRSLRRITILAVLSLASSVLCGAALCWMAWGKP